MSLKRLQTMQKKLRRNSLADLRKVGLVVDAECTNGTCRTRF
jgi:hypothetical protein